MNRTTPKMRAAMKRYYANRAAAKAGGPKWDKYADLDNIWSSCPKRLSRHRPGMPKAHGYQAIAGTFFIYWSDGTQTIHTEKQYWTGSVYTKLDARGRRWYYSDLGGHKCKRYKIERGT